MDTQAAGKGEGPLKAGQRGHAKRACGVLSGGGGASSARAGNSLVGGLPPLVCVGVDWLWARMAGERLL